MKLFTKGAIATCLCCLSLPLPAQALPGENSQQFIQNWRAAHIFPPPTLGRKFRNRTGITPDLDVSGTAAGGRLIFSMFLNSSGISEYEGIDYRPEACESWPYRDCSGKVIFQKSGNDLGHLLIAEVFGPEVLEDFVGSDALKTVKENDPGNKSEVTVFYAGKSFNYSTYVNSEPGRTRSISHFSVMEKNDAKLRNDIRLKEVCSTPAMRMTRGDPLCIAP